MYCAMPSRLRKERLGSFLARWRRLVPGVGLRRAGLLRYDAGRRRLCGLFGQLTRRPHEAGHVAAQVGSDVGRIDLIGLAAGSALGVVVFGEPQPTEDDDGVALAQRLHDVVTELPPARDAHEDRVGVDIGAEGLVEPPTVGGDAKLRDLRAAR